ncbi:MAG: adenylosuccinate synthetase, partial [Candidatus Kapaibacterium sp.]
FEEKLRQNIKENNEVITKVYGSDSLDTEEIVETYLKFDKLIDPFITDTTTLINNAVHSGNKILAEGAQGALLDVDHGTYPYVTSSNPISGGACTGLGIPPTSIKRIIGITKAYCTRVGHGPFPTELQNETGELLRKSGAEFGATTGRPRRCGWLDLVALKYSVMINGITDIALTKLDVLDDFNELNVCSAYTLNGKILKYFPIDLPTLNNIECDYKQLKGWNQSLRGIRKFKDLPQETLAYIKYIEEFVGAKVSIVSTSPDRNDTIFCEE